MSTPKNPTPQGISALLRKAGFEKATETRHTRHHSQTTAGYRVWKMAGEVRVTHWAASGALHIRTTEAIARERCESWGAILRYADVIRAAGWSVHEEKVFDYLAVTAPKERD